MNISNVDVEICLWPKREIIFAKNCYRPTDTHIYKPVTRLYVALYGQSTPAHIFPWYIFIAQ